METHINLKHDTALEQKVLGALLSYPQSLQKAAGMLQADLFYNPNHKQILQAIMALHKQNKVVDIITVLSVLKTWQSTLTAYELSCLTNETSNPHAIEEHVLLLSQFALRRSSEFFGNQLISDANNPATDPLELVEKLENKAKEIQQGYFTSTATQTIGDLNTYYINELEELKLKGIKPGISIQFKDLQKMFGGWKNGDLIVIAARPAMGKTALAMQFVLDAAQQKIPSAFFSLEMANKQIISRWQSLVSGINGAKILNADLLLSEIHELKNTCAYFQTLPLYIEELAAPTMQQVKSKARTLKIKHGIQFLVIDYMQLMVGDDKKGSSREAEISYISRSLKALAKELDLPIIVLSQLSRDVEKRGGSKRPMLSDLRESGAIEQDADGVIFIYRASYYDEPFIRDNIPAEGKAELIIAKNRNGGLLNALVGWEANNTKFYEL
jgi:replicative DNA helicase